MKRIKLTVPAEVLMTAKLASQAMDPDVGGFNAFDTLEENTGLYSYVVDVSQEYYQAFLAFMQGRSDWLYQAIAGDFERRFPGTTPPTLAECEAFCAVVQLEVLNDLAY